MANLILDVNINSARNLKNVNFFGKMDVYAVVTLNGDNTQRRQEVKTPVDRSGGSNPKWNHAVKFFADERLVRDNRLSLDMKLISRRRVLGNKSIGAAHVPILELFNSVTPSTNGDGSGNNQEMRFVKYRVRSRSGKLKGFLVFSYRFNTPMVQPELQTAINKNSDFLAITYLQQLEVGGSYALPVSEIESHSSPPKEPKFEHPLSGIHHDSNDSKHPLAVGDSSSNPLPISYGQGLTNQLYSRSTSQKRGQANLLAQPPLSQPSYEYFSPPQIHNGNGPYLHAPPSSPSDEWTEQRNGIGLGLGLGVGAGLLGGLMMGDIVSDVVNAFDI